MAEPLSDPTRSEARALILGTATFWFAWGLAAATLFANEWLIGLLPFVVGLAAGLWLSLVFVWMMATLPAGTRGLESSR